jgi:Domain of Unknown Function with PDB structure (DUF3857)/Transglutaminase-like superfamily
MFLSCLDKKIFILLSICSVFLLALSGFAQDKDWRPVTPEELAMKSSTVVPDADAEAIFWEVRIDDSSDDQLSQRHYIRVKLFNERGRDKFSKIDIPYYKGLKIKDVAARVIKQDGSVVELKKDEVFDREIVKVGGNKIKAKSFALPGIEPGAIVEYRYREVYEDASAVGMRLTFQREIPVQSLSYYYKPNNGNAPRFQPYNFSDARFTKDDKGFYLAKRTNVAPMKEEPFMPPEDQVMGWGLIQGLRIKLIEVSASSISISIKDPSNMAGFWAGVSTERASLPKYFAEPGKEVTKLAQEVAGTSSAPEEQLKKLYEFCQTQIKNITYDTTVTDEQRAQRANKSKSISDRINDVIKTRSGSAGEIDWLFAAMAGALGHESRIAYSANRNQIFFDPRMTSEYFIHQAAIAVKIGDGWGFFNPGTAFLPYGMLDWFEEDVWALLPGQNNYSWVKTPMTGIDKTINRRSGKFKLSEDGTLEGDVRVELTGQAGFRYKIENYDDAPAKREEDLKQEISKRISAAEVSNISIENSASPDKPLTYSYKVRVPNYAQRTGKRLFLQPNFFKYGENPLFSSGERTYDIYFHYPWSEEDSIEVQLPAGFALDSADKPAPIADDKNIGALNISISTNMEQTVLKYKREFHFGGGDRILFPASAYRAIKNMFDAFNKADLHTITLKQK